MNGPRGNYKWPKRVWALSNFGNLWSIFRTRREAIREAELQTGEPWKKCRRTMEVWPCIVKPHSGRDA